MKIMQALLPQLLGTMAALLLLAEAANSAEVALDRQTITFWSEGARLQGDVFKPSGLAAGDKLPDMLLVHGWGG